jgi:hypothetical protein
MPHFLQRSLAGHYRLSASHLHFSRLKADEELVNGSTYPMLARRTVLSGRAIARALHEYEIKLCVAGLSEGPWGGDCEGREEGGEDDGCAHVDES